MGEIRDDDDDARRAWDELVRFFAASAEHGDAAARGMLDKLRAAGPPPAPSPGRPSPIILDTDIGGDPDDAVAVALAARRLPELALVITTDEHHGQRARFARQFLDRLGRADVPVAAGRDLGNARWFVVQDLLEPEAAAVSSDVAGAVARVLASTRQRVHWVGLGPASNWAALHAAHPELTKRLIVTQMGGALRYRDPTRAEHNFRLDPQAARRLLAEAQLPHLITSDVTFSEELAIDGASALYARLSQSADRTWQALLRRHFDLWFAGRHASSIQHDALALSVALQLPFVLLEQASVRLDPLGRMTRAPRSEPPVEVPDGASGQAGIVQGESAGAGGRVWMSTSADRPRFIAWLTRELFAEGPLPGARATGVRSTKP